MSKQKISVLKSYYDGCIKLRVSAGAHNRGEDIQSTVTVDLTLDAARSLLCQLDMEIIRAGDKMKAKATAEARRKAWRDREVAAGRTKIISFRKQRKDVAVK